MAAESGAVSEAVLVFVPFLIFGKEFILVSEWVRVLVAWSNLDAISLTEPGGCVEEEEGRETREEGAFNRCGGENRLTSSWVCSIDVVCIGCSSLLGPTSALYEASPTRLAGASSELAGGAASSLEGHGALFPRNKKS